MTNGYITAEKRDEIRRSGRANMVMGAAFVALAAVDCRLMRPGLFTGAKEIARLREHRRKLEADIAYLGERPPLPPVPTFTHPYGSIEDVGDGNG